MLRISKISFPGFGIGEFSVDSVAFSIGSVDIAWYALIITCGMILASLYIVFRAKKIGIPQVAIASGSFGWVAIGGVCQAKTGIQAAGDTLEVLNAGTTLVVDGSSGSPAETVGTVAISCETAAAAATVKVNLLNKRVQIAAS